MKIGIIGYGYVGQAMARFFKLKYDVVWYDPARFDSNTKDEVSACEMAVICVPTNMNKDGTCDTSIVEESVEWCKSKTILIKSTVPPGTTKRLIEETSKNIVFSPEYIGESSYYTPLNRMHPTDIEKHPFHVLGGKKELTEKIIDVIVKIAGPEVFFYQTDPTTAEIIKYWENVHGALRVAFFNEMYDICKAFNVDYWEAREGWALDNRVNKSHSAVFSDKRGFSGKCFPKDLIALIRATEKAGYNPSVLKEIWNKNTQWNPDLNKIS